MTRRTRTERDWELADQNYEDDRLAELERRADFADIEADRWKDESPYNCTNRRHGNRHWKDDLCLHCPQPAE